MNFYSQIYIKEEIKIEIPEHYSKEPDYGYQCSDEIEIGNETKTESIRVEDTFNNNFEPSENDEYQLTYCSKCNKTQNYSAKDVKTCLSCSSILTYKCGKCMKKNFSSIRSLNSHYNIHCKRKSKLCCKLCDYNTTVKSNLDQHIQAEHPQEAQNIHKCSRCNKSYSAKSSLKTHLKKCSESLPKYFSCDHCNYKTKSELRISSHIQAKHFPVGNDPKKCNKCNKTFSSAPYMQCHQRICGQTKDFKLSLIQFSCDHCKFKTMYKTSLIGHMQAKHLQGDKNSNKCAKCGRSYMWKSDLSRHSKFCGLAKDFKRSLLRYSCDHCDFKTNQKPKIYDHILAMHLPKDPNSHRCGRCKKSYSNRTSLGKHVKICGLKKVERFSKLKYFYCDECVYKTHFKNALVKHIQTQHFNETCKCSGCGKSFKSSVNLYAHVKYSCKFSDSPTCNYHVKKRFLAKAQSLKKKVIRGNSRKIKVES